MSFRDKATKPILAVTMGDPTGIGPETIAGAWDVPAIRHAAKRIVVGRKEVMSRAAKLLGLSIDVVGIDVPSQASDDPGIMPVFEVGENAADRLPPGKVDPAAGNVAYQALITAIDWAKSNAVQALTTAPLNKEALHLAGHHFPGHTEILAERCGRKNVSMMLYLPPGRGLVKGLAGLGVIHVTLHTALHNVFSELTREKIVDKCRLAWEFVSLVLGANGIRRSPKIGVAALNPHAGENGLFGKEELELIGPAISEAQKEGWTVSGPLPCDTLMHRAAGGEFDAVVAMYHDQGHIALKLLGLHDAVNVTLGLPITRTSVAHGTAFDIAWKGIANPHSMIQAQQLALELCNREFDARS